MKRVLIMVAMLVLIPVLGFVGVMASTFSGRQEMVDGVELPGAARLIKDGYVSMYVLPAGEKEVALVDCGDDLNGAPVLAELKRRGLGPDAVIAIFLTHGHADHLGSCHLFPRAKVFGLAGDRALALGEARSKGPLPSMLDTPVAVRTAMTDPLTDGRSVTVGALTVVAFAVPGHTAGSVAYLANGTLFMGDSGTGASDGTTMKAAPWVFSDDVTVNRQGLEALGKRVASENLEVNAIAFAHSGPFTGAEAIRSFHAAQ